jgi:hypothetical protein
MANIGRKDFTLDEEFLVDATSPKEGGLRKKPPESQTSG